MQHEPPPLCAVPSIGQAPSDPVALRLAAPAALGTIRQSGSDLPTFAAGVPASINLWRKAPQTAALAEALLDERLLQWGKPTPDPATRLIRDTTRSLNAWVQALTHDMPELPLSFVVTDNHSDTLFQHVSGCESDGNENSPIHNKDGGFAFEAGSANPRLFTFRAAITRLEEKHRRLGATVAYILEDILDDLVGCTGPRKALDIASNEHWCGEDDETTRVDDEMDQVEYDEDDDLKGKDARGRKIRLEGPSLPKVTREQVIKDNEIFTKKEFHKDIPEWIYARPMSESAMRKICKTLDGKDRKIVEAAIALRRLKSSKVNDLLHSYGSWCKMDPVILFWKPFGIVGRMYDDLGQHYMESGESHDVSALAAFDPLDTASIRAAIRKITRLTYILRCAFHLVSLTSKPVNRS